MAAPVTFPFLIIQSDWNETLKEQTGKAWITCKAAGTQGIHGELTSSVTERNPVSITASDRFRVENVGENSIEVSHSDPNCKCQFVSPSSTFASVHSKSIVSLDVTSGGLGVSSCVQNKLHVWETEKGVVRRTLEGHVGDVYSCRFFPSGVVILSCGADMQLKVWSAETGQCAATMKGHVRAITDSAIVERGRNVISVSRDGTAKLWDCGKSSCLTDIAAVGCGINGCSISTAPDVTHGLNQALGDREVGTEDKVLLLACEDKTFRGVDIRSRNEIFSCMCTDATNACCFLTSYDVVCGCQDGVVHRYDLRNLSVAVHSWMDSAAAVLTLHKYETGVLVGKSDGLCIYYDSERDKRIQLTGSDCDAIYSMAFDGTHVFTCSRDGVIRKYFA